MTQPVPFNKANTYTGDAYTGADLDEDFDNIETTLDETLANLELIQRDDGKVANASIHPDAFDAGALALIFSGTTVPRFTPKGIWVTGTVYAVGDIVEVGTTGSFIAVTAHTAGAVFATDKAAGKWVSLSGSTLTATLDLFADVTGAARIGSTGPSNVQLDLNARAPTRANIAALRAATTTTLPAGSVNLVGYYTSTVTGTPDGGGGIFTYDSSDVSTADNGGTVIVDASGSRWKRGQQDYLTLKQWGAKGDGSTNDYARAQVALDNSSGKTLLITKSSADYIINSGLTMTGHVGTRIIFEEGSKFDGSSLGSSTYLLTTTNCINCDVEIHGNTAGHGVLVQESSGNSLYNTIRPYLNSSIVRAATKPATPLTAGVQFGVYFKGAAAGKSNYFNVVERPILQDFESAIVLENNANANIINDPQLEGYWYGIYLLCQESNVKGGFCHNSVGVDASNLTEGIRIGDGATSVLYNQIIGTAFEPGAFSRSVLIQANATNNIAIVADNTPYGVSDVASANTVITKNAAYFTGVSNFERIATSGFRTHTSNDQYNTDFFASGGIAQSGAFNSAVRLFGGSSQQRHLRLEQIASGVAAITGSGGLKLDGQASNVEIRDNANGLKVDNNATAGNTRLLLHDVTAGDYVRVSRGAADSGGAGFRLLVIPN